MVTAAPGAADVGLMYEMVGIAVETATVGAFTSTRWRLLFVESTVAVTVPENCLVLAIR